LPVDDFFGVLVAVMITVDADFLGEITLENLRHYEAVGEIAK
jgi:hypothetical protein